jgi:hypothetical protein
MAFVLNLGFAKLSYRWQTMLIDLDQQLASILNSADLLQT